MRILQWSESFVPEIGGVEVLLAHLVRELRERGHELLLITGRTARAREARSEHGGVPVHRLGFRSALHERDLRLLKEQANEVAALKRSFRPDVVHVHLYGPSPLLQRMTARAWPAPTVMTLHTAFEGPERGESSLLRFLLEADAVVALSEAMRRQMLEREPALAERVSVLPNGVQELGEPAPLPRAPATVLCLGRLIPEKGFDLALRAVQRLAARHALRVVIAGDGPARPELERLAAELGLAPISTFLGFVEPAAVGELLNQASVVVVPSRWEEPSACVIREAAWMARPVVASGVGGTPELIEHGRTGLLVDREDVDGLASALASLLGDPERARRLGLAARDRVRSACSMAACAAAYEAVYERAIASGRAAAAC
jgi:glycogen(starch) synthase